MTKSDVTTQAEPDTSSAAPSSPAGASVPATPPVLASKAAATPATPEQASPVAYDAQLVSLSIFKEENPRLCREAHDILARTNGADRKTRAEWRKLADTYGGDR